MTKLMIEAEKREATRARVKTLRLQGQVPVVVYGKGVATQNLQVSERSLNSVLQHGGMSQLVDLTIQGGGKQNILVREVQRHPVNHRVIHADLYAVRMDEKQEVEIPIHRVGKPLTLTSDVMVLQNRETVLVEALPGDLPTVIEIDISKLSLENPILTTDLPKLPGVVYLVDDQTHFFSMQTVGGQLAALEAEDAAPAEEPEVVGKDENKNEE